jgi:hypothetical protein
MYHSRDSAPDEHIMTGYYFGYATRSGIFHDDDVPNTWGAVVIGTWGRIITLIRMTVHLLPVVFLFMELT